MFPDFGLWPLCILTYLYSSVCIGCTDIFPEKFAVSLLVRKFPKN
jgi:hypothetical protein